MFILLGVVFIAYEGTSALGGLYAAGGAEDLALAAQQWIGGLTRGVLEAAVLAFLAAAAAGFYLYRLRGGKKKSAPEPDRGS